MEFDLACLVLMAGLLADQDAHPGKGTKKNVRRVASLEAACLGKFVNGTLKQSPDLRNQPQRMFVRCPFIRQIGRTPC